MSKNQLTKIAEAVEQLDALDGADPESSHFKADEVLCQTLRELGAGEVADAFERAADRVGFWYA